MTYFFFFFYLFIFFIVQYNIYSDKTVQTKVWATNNNTTMDLWVRVCVCVCVRVCGRPGRAVRDYGGRDSQNPDPIRPCSAQKVLRESLQTGRRSGRQIHSETDSRGRRREWQWRRNWERLTKRQTEIKKTEEEADGMTRMRNTKVSVHIIANKMLNITILVRFTSHPEQAVLFGNKNWAFFAHLIA